jgi:IMP dehydrogenase/GMP reductase
LLKAIRKKFKYEQLIAGNIATYEAAVDLIECGLMQ